MNTQHTPSFLKLNFPLKDKDGKNWLNAEGHYRINEETATPTAINEKGIGGWYPVGNNQLWHSGIHQDGDRPLHAIADGIMIAYRVTDTLIDPATLLTFVETEGEPAKSIMAVPASDNFVLIKHSFQPPGGKAFSFYVLYLHLQTYGYAGLSQEQKAALPLFYRSRLTAAKPLPIQSRLAVDPQYTIGEVATDDELVFESPEKIVDETTTFKPLWLSDQWQKVQGYYHHDQFYSCEGYVHLTSGELKATKIHEPALGGVRSVSIPIRKGEVIGWTGSDGTRKDKKTVHLELFMKDKQDRDNLLTYTDQKLKETPSLEKENLLHLTDEFVFYRCHLRQAYVKKTEKIAGTSERAFTNLAELLLKTDFKGGAINPCNIRTGLTDPKIARRLRPMVACHQSEWSPTRDFSLAEARVKDDLGWKPDKIAAFKENSLKTFAFWHLLRDETGNTFPDEVYFFHPIAFIDHLQQITKEDDIVFVLNDSQLGEEKCLILTPQESEELRKEEQELARLIEKLQVALEHGKEATEELQSEDKRVRQAGDRNANKAAEKIQTAKEAIASALTKHSTKTTLANLTEIRRLSGRKTTYVRSDKIKNHWRSYSLDTDDKKKSLRTQNGRLDTRKLKDQFLKSTQKISKKWPIASGSVAGLFGENFKQYIEELNKSLAGSTGQKQTDPKEVHFDTSKEAQLLRYYANAALESTVNFKQMQFGISGSINGSVAVAEGKLRSRAYWPHQAGLDLRFELKGKRFDFGSIRAYLEVNVTGFAGASVMGSVCIEFTKSKDNDKLVVKGVNKAGKNKKPDQATASGKLFAGVEAGGEVVGKCEWDNPEKRSDPNSPAWCEFVAIGYGLKGAAGLGAEAEFKIEFENGKFMFKARAGLVLGLGAGGEILGSVDAGTIAEFVQFIYHQLKNHGYHFLDAITTLAFQQITQLSVWAIETGNDITDFGRGVAQGVSDNIEESVNTISREMNRIENWWYDRQETKHQAQTLARNILADPEKLKCTSPEAKGIMLHHLCQTFWEINEEPQEQAILKILEHVQSTREYQKVCEHLTKDGSKTEFLTGHMTLVKILDGEEQYQFRELRRKWRNDLIDRWESGWKIAFNESTKKNSPVEICPLV